MGDLQKQKEAEKSFAIKAAGFGCLALWMSTNSFPWDNIQKISGIAATLVSSLQFPNRFLGWGTVLLVTVTGYVIRYFQNNRKIFYQMSLITAVVSLSASYLFMMDSGVQKRDVTLYNQESMGFGYISGEEYLIYGTDSTKLTFARPEVNENIQIADYEKSGLNISFSCRNDSPREEIVTLPVLMYKGYAARDDKGEVLEITDDGGHILQVCIPGGYAGTVRVRFVEPWYWRTAELVTLITVAGIVFSGFGRGDRDEKEMDFISGRASLSGSVRAVFWGIGYCIRGRSSAIVSGGRNRGIVSKDFALNPGVYRIIVESDIANGGIGSGMEISLEAEETTFRAIRGNRATLSADTEHKRITYYVADTVDAAHLQIQPFSEGGNVSYELKVEKTTAGRRILL